jgi:hypothetical protein
LAFFFLKKITFRPLDEVNSTLDPGGRRHDSWRRGYTSRCRDSRRRASWSSCWEPCTLHAALFESLIFGQIGKGYYIDCERDTTRITPPFVLIHDSAKKHFLVYAIRESLSPALPYSRTPHFDTFVTLVAQFSSL